MSNSHRISIPNSKKQQTEACNNIRLPCEGLLMVFPSTQDIESQGQKGSQMSTSLTRSGLVLTRSDSPQLFEVSQLGAAICWLLFLNNKSEETCIIAFRGKCAYLRPWIQYFSTIINLFLLSEAYDFSYNHWGTNALVSLYDTKTNKQQKKKPS